MSSLASKVMSPPLPNTSIGINVGINRSSTISKVAPEVSMTPLTLIPPRESTVTAPPPLVLMVLDVSIELTVISPDNSLLGWY